MEHIKTFENFFNKKSAKTAEINEAISPKDLAEIICDFIAKEYGIDGYQGSQVSYIQNSVADLIVKNR